MIVLLRASHLLAWSLLAQSLHRFFKARQQLRFQPVLDLICVAVSPPWSTGIQSTYIGSLERHDGSRTVSNFRSNLRHSPDRNTCVLRSDRWYADKAYCNITIPLQHSRSSLSNIELICCTVAGKAS